MNSFWNKLPKPFSVLAPMEGVTDFVFRQIIVEIGKPDVLFTEFTNVEGLSSKGFEKVVHSLKFSKNENPIVAQIWGLDLEAYYKAAVYCKNAGFAGVDINMGCPVKDVLKKGACAGLIANPQKAKEIIEAVKKGVGNIPVSVKTRIGYKKEEIDEWIGFLLKQDLSAITVHLRTVSEMSKVPAHWEYMTKIIDMRNNISPKTLIVGNGDILSSKDLKEKHQKYFADGYMVGRGIFHNPWIFNEKIDIDLVSTADRFNLYLKHIDLFEKTWGATKNPALLKKFCKTYINNFNFAKEMREEIMNCKNILEMKEIIDLYKRKVS